MVKPVAARDSSGCCGKCGALFVPGFLQPALLEDGITGRHHRACSFAETTVASILDWRVHLAGRDGF